VLLSCFLSRVQEDRESCWLVVCSALALLVAQVLADHHDPAVTADHLALVADLLDARLNLHLPAVFIGPIAVWVRSRATGSAVGWIGRVRRVQGRHSLAQR